ncbi:MAG TPA: cyclic pyranopterin monophosphate synthase MoaC [Gemmatimonadaceae bacterium]|nr:cyclic pyranopterin monophosphate synthase MoaC [Gemmatimonadaceae bacterium]
MSELSHVGPGGEARMVDVSSKAVTPRLARATGAIRMKAETLALIRRNGVAKGDVLAVAKVAGIMAAKRTAELIPLCHPLPLTDVQVTLEPDEQLPGIRAEATARTAAQTGVEMEAITAVAVALITIYDMAKAADREMEITSICLQEKVGGKSGSWRRA